ncbi:hypothetical protein [Streptomonospora litoralis]|uniref:Uncharacterized protein n=1 Tax=Streptomonospora litoralis TaxID=2498135 RepID=A0A4P6Q035_9ACTN|nr:hypothetical protein [Streptomonospora litoralis]QBI51857.1 hypothetical protein EKD16_00150 [Streptomonospora litoralis]
MRPSATDASTDRKRRLAKLAFAMTAWAVPGSVLLYLVEASLLAVLMVPAVGLFYVGMGTVWLYGGPRR